MRDTKKEIDAFNASLAADEIDIERAERQAHRLDSTPYKAEVAFDKVFYQTGTRISPKAGRNLHAASLVRAARRHRHRVSAGQSVGPAHHRHAPRTSLQATTAALR